MAYCTQTDLETNFGTSNIRIWSNKENDTTQADVGAITEAIEWAAEVIDDRLRDGPYTLPLAFTSGTSRVVKRWNAVLAAEYLYSNRGIDDDDDTGGRLAHLAERVQQEISEYMAGQRTLPAQRAADGGKGPVAV